MSDFYARHSSYDFATATEMERESEAYAKRAQAQADADAARFDRAVAHLVTARRLAKSGRGDLAIGYISLALWLLGIEPA